MNAQNDVGRVGRRTLSISQLCQLLPGAGRRRGHRDASLLPPRASRSGGGRGQARVHRQADRRRRARVLERRRVVRTPGWRLVLGSNFETSEKWHELTRQRHISSAYCNGFNRSLRVCPSVYNPHAGHHCHATLAEAISQVAAQEIAAAHRVDQNSARHATPGGPQHGLRYLIGQAVDFPSSRFAFSRNAPLPVEDATVHASVYRVRHMIATLSRRIVGNKKKPPVAATRVVPLYGAGNARPMGFSSQVGKSKARVLSSEVDRHASHKGWKFGTRCQPFRPSPRPPRFSPRFGSFVRIPKKPHQK